MRRTTLLVLAFSALLPLSHAQNAPDTLDDRRKALAALSAQYWDSVLDHSPEFASEIGDARYNSKLTDYSPKAQNLWAAREQDYLLKLAAIDPTGFTPAEANAREDLLTQLTNDVEAAGNSNWQTPVTADGDIFTQYPALDDELPFTTVKDYDDWIARLRALPDVLDRAISNMAAGIDDHRVPPKPVLEEALTEIRQIAGQKPEDSDFAGPLKRFPASISASDQQRIQTETLSVITKQVLPAYRRLVRFLEVSYIPAAASSASQPATQTAANAPLTLQARQIRILTLRDKAQDALGSRFSLSAFHDALNGYATLPLQALEDHINAWIASQSGGK